MRRLLVPVACCVVAVYALVIVLAVTVWRWWKVVVLGREPDFGLCGHLDGGFADRPRPRRKRRPF